MAAPFKKQQTSDKNLEFIQNNVDAALTPLQAMPMVGGNVVSDISFTANTGLAVAHGLGRPARYFIVLTINANTPVWAPGTASDKNFIYLEAGASCVATIWVN